MSTELNFFFNSAMQYIYSFDSCAVFHPHSFFGAMPAYVETSKCLGVKLLTFYRNNPDENIASHPHAVIALFEPSTGVPLVVSRATISLQLQNPLVAHFVLLQQSLSRVMHNI